MTTKFCIKCDTPLESGVNWPREKHSDHRCVVCYREYARLAHAKFRAENPERAKEIAAKHQRTAGQKATRKRWYQKNAAMLRTRRRALYHQNAERIALQRRERREALEAARVAAGLPAKKKTGRPCKHVADNIANTAVIT
jgi:hypothetical protein